MADDDDYVMHTKPMFVVPDPEDPSTWWDEFGNFIGSGFVPSDGEEPQSGEQTGEQPGGQVGE